MNADSKTLLPLKARITALQMLREEYSKRTTSYKESLATYSTAAYVGMLAMDIAVNEAKIERIDSELEWARMYHATLEGGAS